jgi:hypothetical protein
MATLRRRSNRSQGHSVTTGDLRRIGAQDAGSGWRTLQWPSADQIHSLAEGE